MINLEKDTKLEVLWGDITLARRWQGQRKHLGNPRKVCPEVSRTEVSYTLKYNNLSQQHNKYPPATTRTPGYLTEPRAGASRLMEVPYLFMLGFWTIKTDNVEHPSQRAS